MNPSSLQPRHPGRRRRNRRGAAVVLALVAVSVATLLGLSLASTRDATVATSGNLAKTANARAAAASGVDLATSMLASEGAFDRMQGAVLFEGVQLNGATVRAEVRDIQTGGPATAESAAIEIVVQSQHDGATQVARAVGRAPAHAAPMRADLDCSEFALLGTEAVEVEEGAHVGPWGKSPLATLAEPVRFGTSAGAGAGVNIAEGSSMHGCVEMRRGAFATDEETANEALADKRFAVPAAIHVPAAPVPDAPRGVAARPSLMIDGLVSEDAASSGDARVPARGSATIRGSVTLDVGGNLFVERGSRVYIEQSAVIVVRGNAVVDAASIEVAPSGSLTLIALGDLTLSSAFVGAARSDPSEGRDASGNAAFDGGARRTVLFGGGDSRRILVTDGSIVKGQIYAPSATVTVESRSAVYGRLLGSSVQLAEGVALYYDPCLDARHGWTSPASGLWTSGGTLRSEVTEVARLDDASLLEFATRTGIEPEPASQAIAAVALEDQVVRTANFNERAELEASDETKRKRRGLREQLRQRATELRERWKDALFEPLEAGGQGFVQLGTAEARSSE
jgi:hypothetical protein